MSAKEQQDQNFFRRWVVNHWELVNRLARRRFSDEVLAEEAALYVMEVLEKDDWRLLGNYRGSARLKTYFSSVVYNLLEDFARNRFGRVRPPLWLKKLGGIWLTLYRLLCLERFSYLEATSQAADRYKQLRLDQIEKMADRILGEIASCGASQYLQVPVDEHGHDGRSSPPTTQNIVEEKERELVLKALHDQFFGTETGQQKMAAITKLADCSIELKSEERLLLKLCHVQGLSVAEAGKKLGWNRFQTHGKLRRLYKRIRQMFESAGHSDELRLLLEEESDTK